MNSDTIHNFEILKFASFSSSASARRIFCTSWIFEVRRSRRCIIFFRPRGGRPGGEISLSSQFLIFNAFLFFRPRGGRPGGDFQSTYLDWASLDTKSLNSQFSILTLRI